MERVASKQNPALLQHTDANLIGHAFDLALEATPAPLLRRLLQHEARALPFLNAVVYLWPRRDLEASQLRNELVDWSRKLNPWLAVNVAIALNDDDRELADQIAAAIDERGNDARLYPALLAIHRLSRPGDPDPRDDAALRRADPTSLLVGHDGEPFHRLLRLVEADRRDISWLQPTIDDALRTPMTELWASSIWVLASRPSTQSEAITALVSATRQAEDPVRPLRLATIPGLEGLFWGPGWGERQLPGKKLLPLSRAFIDRGVWPTPILAACFRPRLHRRGVQVDEDLPYERIRDMLAEALLSMALDHQHPVHDRRLAIEVVASLGPRDESFIKALSTLNDTPLATHARNAIRQMSTSFVDAELAVRDACDPLGLRLGC